MRAVILVCMMLQGSWGLKMEPQVHASFQGHGQKENSEGLAELQSGKRDVAKSLAELNHDLHMDLESDLKMINMTKSQGSDVPVQSLLEQVSEKKKRLEEIEASIKKTGEGAEKSSAGLFEIADAKSQATNEVAWKNDGSVTGGVGQPVFYTVVMGTLAYRHQISLWLSSVRKLGKFKGEAVIVTDKPVCLAKTLAEAKLLGDLIKSTQNVDIYGPGQNYEGNVHIVKRPTTRNVLMMKLEKARAWINVNVAEIPHQVSSIIYTDEDIVIGKDLTAFFNTVRALERQSGNQLALFRDTGRSLGELHTGIVTIFPGAAADQCLRGWGKQLTHVQIGSSIPGLPEFEEAEKVSQGAAQAAAKAQHKVNEAQKHLDFAKRAKEKSEKAVDLVNDALAEATNDNGDKLQNDADKAAEALEKAIEKMEQREQALKEANAEAEKATEEYKIANQAATEKKKFVRSPAFRAEDLMDDALDDSFEDSNEHEEAQGNQLLREEALAMGPDQQALARTKQCKARPGSAIRGIRILPPHFFWLPEPAGLRSNRKAEFVHFTNTGRWKLISHQTISKYLHNIGIPKSIDPMGHVKDKTCADTADAATDSLLATDKMEESEESEGQPKENLDALLDPKSKVQKIMQKQHAAPETKPTKENYPDEYAKLWLGYDYNSPDVGKFTVPEVVCGHAVDEPIGRACDELTKGLSQMMGFEPKKVTEATQKGAVVLELTNENLRDAAPWPPQPDAEGFELKTSKCGSVECLKISSASGPGVLRGAFWLLNMIKREAPELQKELNIKSKPSMPLRMWDLWDNRDRTVEHGYAGHSLIFYEDLPNMLPRYQDYARLLASTGINAIVWNNVHACKFKNQEMLKTDSLRSMWPVVALFHSYGVRSFITPCYNSPSLDGLSVDPKDAKVAKWWSKKAEEISQTWPQGSFGGFMFNAENQKPGMSEIEFANLMGEALQSVNGIAIYRAFSLASDSNQDQYLYQSKRFAAWDGKTRNNVVLQMKYGPGDFQNTEPVHALFGKLRNVSKIVEVQATQEYSGQAKHVAHLVPMWKKVLDFDTYANGEGSTLASILKGSSFSGFAAVSNFGSDATWTGHPMSAANSYGAGRLAWDPSLSAQDVTQEWVELTFGKNKQVSNTLVPLMMRSLPVFESATAPLGWGWHSSGTAAPGGAPNYDLDLSARNHYVHATKKSIGFDRTCDKAKECYLEYYPEPLKSMYADVDKCPENLLLHFHNVPYTHKLHDGRTVEDAIHEGYELGATESAKFVEEWEELRSVIDTRSTGLSFDEIREKLVTGAADAKQFATKGSNWFQALMADSASLSIGAKLKEQKSSDDFIDQSAVKKMEDEYGVRVVLYYVHLDQNHKHGEEFYKDSLSKTCSALTDAHKKFTFVGDLSTVQSIPSCAPLLDAGPLQKSFADLGYAKQVKSIDETCDLKTGKKVAKGELRTLAQVWLNKLPSLCQMAEPEPDQITVLMDSGLMGRVENSTRAKKGEQARKRWDYIMQALSEHDFRKEKLVMPNRVAHGNTKMWFNRAECRSTIDINAQFMAIRGKNCPKVMDAYHKALSRVSKGQCPCFDEEYVLNEMLKQEGMISTVKLHY